MGRKNPILAIVFLLFSFLSLSAAPFPAPQDGDYQTRATGNWNVNTTWQVRSGGAWVNCVAGDYPGVVAGSKTVNILNGHVVTLTANVPNAIGALSFEDATTLATSVVMSTRNLTVTDGITFGAPSADAGDQSITVTTGTLTCGYIYMPTTGDPTYDDLLSFTSGTLSVSGNIIMDGASDRNAITYTAAGTLNAGGNFTGGGFTSGTSTVTYNGITQQTGGYTYYNLIMNGGGTKTLAGSAAVTNTLTLTSGVIRLGANDLTITSANAVAGSPFSITKMIETDGTGHFIRAGNLNNNAFNQTYPVGSNGYYNPLVVSGLANIAAAARSFSVRAVPANLGVLTNIINKYWDLSVTNITTNAAMALSFAYNAGEVTGDPSKIQLYTNTSGAWLKATGASAAGSNPSISTGSATITGLWTVGAPGTFYSYQTGNWNSTTTWTFDPGGTTGPCSFIPSLGDKVVILDQRTVTLTSDITTQNIDLTINSGGILNQSTFRFTNGLTALRGGGVLKLSSSSFPTPITTNTFVTTDGGTTEYNAAVTMPAAQTTYYHLSIRTAGTVIQAANLSLNGNLNVRQGALQINDATAQRLQLIVNGNVTVDNTGSITVGTGVTNSQVSPLGITGTTGGFINYYELQSHRIQVYGDFTNNGIVRLTNLPYPVYNSFPPIVTGPTTGFASIYFNGLGNKTLTCNGQTDFYNLVVDKGSGQTFKLTVYSSAYNNFRIFGANTSEAEVLAPATTANPNVRKAIWIRNGTLILQGLSVIPSLTEGAVAGPPSSDFYIPSNGALLLDGGGVMVLSTADDYREVNGAYGVAAPDNVSMGINATGDYCGLSVSGKLQINDGYLSTRESGGIIYWNYAPGQFIQNGGTVDAKQFHSSSTPNSLISFTQTGGTLLLRGRFQRTTTVFTPDGLKNAPLNNVRAANGVDGTAGSFSITNSGGANGYSMSGGTIRIYDVCGTSSPTYAFQVACAASDINVTGGTVEIIPTTGSIPSNDADYLINTTAQFNNLIINRASGSASVQLNTNGITVLRDLTVSSGVLTANNLFVTIGGDFMIAAGTTYTPGSNTTKLNGTGTQTFSLYAAQTLNNFTIDKPAGISINMAGTSGIVINIAGNFRLVGGILQDNGNTINIAGSVFNSGIHKGAGKIVLNSAVPQTIDGNGIFGNVDLNNTNATSVSLLANMTVKGTLTFLQNRLFNIGTFNLRLDSSASVAGSGTSRYVQTAGNNGDGGVTKVFTSPAAFNFPVGVTNYTPASIGFSAAPSNYGSVTINPVNYAHPNVTTSGRSLTYYWRVVSSGFTLGSATVTHGYTYAESNVVTGGTVSENEYVAARYNSATSNWSKGTSSDVDETANIIGEPGSGSFLENATFIDGEYTAGDDNPTDPFGTPQTFYSRQTGLWSNVSTWSLTSHTVDNPPAVVPGANDIVIIGGQDSVYLTTNNTVANTGSVSCATLQIERGSALDVGFNPSSIFSRVITHSNGNGNFRVTTNFTWPATYVFPSGDFTDFNVNMGTTELYTTNPAPGGEFYLPANVGTYGNLILSPLGGSNVMFPNRDITIYGNLITRGQNADSWFCPSWGTTYPGPVAAVAKTITIRGNMDIQGGALIWYNNGAIAENFVIEGNVKVATQSALFIWSGATGQAMSIGGSLINNTNGLTNGTGTQAKVDFTNIAVTFFGPNSASITNTSGTPITDFQGTTLTINKGISQATTLTLDIGGTLTTPTDNWLILQNGTFRYMRTDPGTDFTISTTNPFSIPATAGLYVNLPSNTGNRNILIGNAGNNNGDLLLNGKLTLINGRLYVGQVGAPNNNNDIEYSGGGSSAIEIQGGLMVVNGQIRRNPSNAGGILKYVQSGGSVAINGRNFVNTNAKFEVVNNGSEFTMSNGTITIIRGNGGTTTPSSPFGDVYIRPQTGSVTGGTVIFATSGSGAQNYFLDATVPLYNLTITGGAGQVGTVRLLTSPLTVNGDMMINANSVLNSNNINITFNGNFTNTPGVAGYVAGTNLTTFSASNGSSYAGAQSLTGVTTFYDLLVAPGVSLTLNNPVTANRNLTISSGGLICGANAVNVKGNIVNNANYTDNNSVGSGVLLNGISLQHISGTGAFARLTLNNAAGGQTETDISLQEDLTMTSGILDIQQNLLTLGLNSLIQGAPFSASKMIITDGVYSTGGIRKFFNSGASPAFLYPLGTGTKYTPATLTISANGSIGYVRVNNVNSQHPGVIDPANALDYYWAVQSSGVTSLNGSLVTAYLQEDVIGIQEAIYQAARLIVPGTTWVKTAGVDPALNTITFNYASSNNLGGEYTAGISSAFPSNVPEYTSNQDGNWSNNLIWTQTGGDPYPCPFGGPNGFIVIINHVVTADANNCTAYRTTINNKLRIVSPFFGHNLGTVTGSGTLYLEQGSFPAGVFTAFLSCASNSTVEYGGTGIYTIVADLYDEIPKLHFTGTGTRILPNKDITICTQLLIDGPVVDNSEYNRKLTIEGTFERYNTGVFISGTESGAIVSFAGSAAQTIGGVLGDFTGTSSFNNFEIKNTSGLTVNNGGAVEVSGNLLLTSGLINTSTTGSLTITNTLLNSVTPAGGSTSSFVNGPLIKKINQYEDFVFPIGKYIAGPGNVLGNKLRISSTQSGPVLWSAEYMSPNSTSSSFTAPLIVVSALEFWNVKATAGNQSILNINWTPTSDITPLVAGSLSAMRLSKFDTGSWIEIPTTSTGDNYNGTASSTNLLSSSGSDNYTLASVSNLIPSAKLSPTGPVCGVAGIPVTFSTPAPAFDYTLTYKIGAAVQPPVTINSAMVPYTLPTAVPGVYTLTGFKYNNGSQTGTVDATPVTVYAEPSVSNAGPDQAICGITTANLAANTPLVGAGFWSVVTGSGGNFISPTSPTSQFIGLNGVVYTLRWTISNGSCQSTDNVIINFLIAPDEPAASSPQNFCAGATIANIAATPPPACTIDWYDAATGGSLLPSGTLLINNTTYYAESNAGCVSFARTPVLVTISDAVNPTITCSSDITTNIDPGVCTASVAVPNATVADNCGVDLLTWSMAGATTASSPLTGINQVGTYTFNLGITTVSYIVKDAAGNQAICSFVVTVNDNIPPVITLPVPPVLNADAGCQATVPVIAATFSDNCTAVGSIITSQVPAAGTVIGSGITAVTITATDLGGNVTTSNINVTVVDVTDPVITAPANPAINLNGTCQAFVPDFLTGLLVSDNCTPAGSILLSQNPVSGATIMGVGTTNVKVYAEDASGNIDSITVIVTTKDLMAPTAVCRDISLYLDGTGSAVLAGTDIDNGSTDNCSVLSFFVSRTNFNCADVGAPVSVTLTATDASGNFSTCNSLVTVLDTISPTVNVKTFNLVLDATGNGTLLPSDVNNSSFDNCGPITLSVAPNTFSCGDQGSAVVTLTAVDSYGNSSSKNVTITISSSLNINSMSLNSCDLAAPFALYSADVIGGNGTYSYYWDVLETGAEPYMYFDLIFPFIHFSGTSSEETPFFNNLMPDGTYHIRLVVTDGNGCADTSQMVMVKGGTTFNNVTLKYSDACEGEVKTYSVTYYPTATYSWSVTNGTILTPIDTNVVDVQWNLAVPQGVIVANTVKPDLIGNDCGSSVVDTVSIHPVPVPAFNSPVLNVCSNSEITYTLTNTYTSYTWIVTGGSITGGGTGSDNFVTVRWGFGAAGKITATVENGFTCSGSVFIDVVIYNLIGTITAQTNVTCNGAVDGTVTAVATAGAGMPPYQYSLDGGGYQASGFFTGIGPGNHTVRIRDFLLCTYDLPFTITQPAPLIGTITSQTNVTCSGGNDGAINLTPSGGTSPYTFLWSNGATTEDISGLTAGLYSVTITDVNLCTTLASATITQPVAIVATAGNNGPVCEGTSLTLTGGPNGMTTYSWTGPNGFTSLQQNPVVSPNATLAMAGAYNLTVTNALGCTGAASTNVSITPLNTITLTSAPATTSQTVCINTAITNITYSTTGATGATVTGLPAGVTGTWAANVVTISGTPTVSGPFNYTVTLTGGCGTVTSAGTLTVTPNNTITLTSAPATASQTVCINTAIANITYSTTGATGATVTGLPAGVTGTWAANVVTISGTPTAAGPFNYTVTLTGGCGTVTSTGTLTVTPNNTITLTSAPATTSQTVCINTAIANITYSTTGATGATVTGLPAGVTGTWAANVVTISGIPTASGPFNYTVTLTGGCGNVTSTGTLTVTPNNTITLTSAPGSDNQSVCIGDAISAITYITTGATGANFTGLPAGMFVGWAANTVTISGSPTTSGNYTYTIELTGGCGTVSASGTITVAPVNTSTLTSGAGTDAQAVCVNSPITNITYATTGATGATVTGLPAGVTGTWAANVVTISGTPTAAGPFNYTVTLTGGCGTVTSTGTITVTPVNTITLTSAPATTSQTVCISTAITNITYSTTGATGATVTGLPAGVTGSWAANVVTISGTPTTSGLFSYTVTLTGGCGTTTASGTITVASVSTIGLTSGAGTDAQTVCVNTPITDITYATTGASGATVTGLPAGVTGTWAANVVTISGSPTATGPFSYTVTLTGGCGTVTASGTISVTVGNTVTLTSAAGTDNQTVCNNTAISNITYATTGATGATVTGLPSGVTGSWAAGVVTITGTPTVSGLFNYTVTLTGGCGTITATGTINSSADNTIILTSGAGSDSQTVCIGNPINAITYITTGATGANFTGLPAGMMVSWAGSNVTISGSPTTSGVYSYTINLTGGCGTVSTTGTITVVPINTITLTSAAGTDNQTACINTAITNITYATVSATGATISNLPSGVTGSWAANTVTITGTPTVSGTFNYTIDLTGGCGTISTTGTIIVSSDNTVTLTSVPATTAQTVCINTALTDITYATTGATGAGVTGLPAGVTGSWAAGIVTISGTPTASGIYNYTVTLTGGCGTVTTAGTITVSPDNTIALSSAAGTDAQTLCINTALTNITYATTGATGANVTGLPAGLTGTWAADVVSISGTPTASGTFSYTVTLTGGCGIITSTGTITVTPDNTITLTSVAGSDAQTVCINSAITNITYATTGASGATVSGLPAGVTGSWAGDVVTISGTPSVSGLFTYTVTLTGGCGTISTTGTLTVSNLNTITLTSGAGTDAQSVCINTAITTITYSTTGATAATITGLPAGVSGSWAADLVTISGTPAVSGTFAYTVDLTGGCGTISTNGSITVNPDNTITFTSGAGTDNQTVCINTAITNITYATTGATGASVAGLPAGVIGLWAANVLTISGSPANSGVFNYTVTLSGGCGTATSSGTINVTSDNTVALSSAAGTDSQTLCINTAIADITYSTTGATGATVSGLPTGVTGSWAANSVTITGTPTESGTFNYTVTLTGGCGNVTAAGTINVSAVNTITLTSGAGTDNQTVCLGDPIVTITYVTTVATGANFTGLPVGMTVAWAANVVTISGTPANSGVFAYQIDLTGGCGTVSTGGTLTVLPANTTTLTSAAGTDTQNACINTPVTDIIYATTGATGATFAGLPAGVTGTWAANVVTISGTPTVSGISNYTVTLTGGCGVVTANGTITVSNDNTVTLSSVAGTDNQTICESSAITDITYATTGATGATITGLPAGLTGSWAADVVTITGTPSESGTFNYIVTLTGGCGTASANGIINITAALPVSVSIAADANPVCAGTTVNFIATPVNQGTTPAYQWQVNGVNAGIDSIGFSYIPVNNDTITVILTSSEVCTSANPDTSALVIMTVHDLPVGSTTATDVACFGQSTGSVDLAMTGGVLPLTFLWSNGATTEDLTAVIAGIYSVTITDGNNCTLVVSDTINEPASALSGAITSQTNVSTVGGNDGSVTVDGSGGTPPYLYSLDGGAYQASGTFSSLTARNYTVTVQDLNLCSVDVPVTITEPFIPLTGAITSQTDVLCFGNATGSVTVTGIDGVLPYEYSLNGGTYQSSGTFNSLIAGTYTVTIRDAYANIYDVPVTITQPGAALSVATSKVDVNCNGSSDGIAVALASGGTGVYIYSWNTTPVQVSDTATGLIPGTYRVTVTDANACTITADVTITEPAVLRAEASSTEAKCPDSNDGSITLDITGGTPVYSVIWSDGITSPNRTNVFPGTYNVVITDANGCGTTASTVVDFVGTFECVEIPNIITPDPPDGYNDTWIIRNILIYTNAEVKVYSRWGKLIYHTKNPLAEPWDGRYSNGRLVPTDSYRYILDLHDGSKVRSGVISVIR